MDKPTCSIGGCDKRIHCSGLCPMHYQRLRRTGSLDKPQPKPREIPPPCTEPDCDTPGNRKGLCEAHYKRQWHEANWDRLYVAAKARREADREAYLAASRAYYVANRDRILAQMASAHAANPHKKRDYMKEWLRKNPMRRREQNMRRNALKRETQVGPVDYAAILAEHGMFCNICWLVIVDESDLHFDHLIPLSMGGAHVAENIKPAHALCNIRKGGRWAS